MQAPAPIQIPAVLPDLPVNNDQQDKLDFIPYANTVREIILSDQTETPLTIGIFGSWGSGKTSLMRMIEQGLKDDAEEKLDSGATGFRVTQPIWFNAWLYSKEDLLWRALIGQVMAGIRQMRIPESPGEDEKARKQAEDEKQRHLDELDRQLYRATGPSQLGTLSIKTSDLLSKEQTARQNAEITLTVLQGLDLLYDLPGAEEDAAERAKKLRAEVQRATARLEQERTESLERFKDTFSKLIDLYVKRLGYLVIFVDDLDRCLPEKAVEVLEAIKLFLDVPGCIFVLGIDREVVERGIRLRYGEMAGVRDNGLAPFLLSPDVLPANGEPGKAAEYRAFLQELVRPDEDVIDGGRYLEKIIQIPFVLPPISREAMGTFIAQLAPNLPHLQCGPTFYTGLEPNPRQVKRAINIFTLLWRLSQNLGESRTELRDRVKPVRLAKMVVIQQRHPRLYDVLRDQPEQIIEWENYFRDKASLPRPDLFADYDPDLLRTLEEVLIMHPLSGPLSVDTNFADLSPDEARIYVYLTMSIKESVAAPPTPPVDSGILEEAPPAAGEGEAAAGLTLGGELDESALGYLKERVYSLMEELVKEPVDEATGLSPDRRQVVLERLAESGGELYLQLSTARPEEFQSVRVEPTTIRLNALHGEAQMPLEVVYDGALPTDRLLMKQSYAQQESLDVQIDGFWGFKHIIERPLFAPAGTSASPERVTTTELRYGDRPRVMLAVNPKESSVQRAVDAYSALAEEASFELQVLEKLQDIRPYLGDARPQVVVFHVPAVARRGEISLNFIDERLTRRMLESWTAPSDPPPTQALFLLDVAAGLGQRNEWSAYLEGLAGIGAAGVVAPMSAPHRSWSTTFALAFLRSFLSGTTAGEALRGARHALLEQTKNPFGLYYAHFGPAAQHLVAEPPMQAAA